MYLILLLNEFRHKFQHCTELSFQKRLFHSNIYNSHSYMQNKTDILHLVDQEVS